VTDEIWPDHGRLVIAAGDYKRDRGAWLKARKSGLGASDTAAILGLNPYKTALDVWREKTAAGDPSDREVSEAAAMGHLFETPVARRTVKQRPDLGKLVATPGLLAHPELSWMLATVDFGLAARRNRAAPVTALLEVKTTSVRAYRRNWPDGVPPALVQVQAQQQMAVTGLRRCWVTVAVGGLGSGLCSIPDPYPVDFSPDVFRQLVDYAGSWWEDFVVAGVMPAPLPADAGKLGDLWPVDDSLDAAELTPDLEATLAGYLDAKRRRDAAALDLDAAAVKLQAAIGPRTALAAPDGTAVATWKQYAGKRSLDKKALAAERPDVAEVVEQFTRTGEPYRRFIVKEDVDS
jgi:putative phage-type endonuclease